MTKRTIKIIFGWILLLGSLYGLFFFGTIAVVGIPIVQESEMFIRLLFCILCVSVAYVLISLARLGLRLIQDRKKNWPPMNQDDENLRVRCNSCGGWVEIGTNNQAKCTYCGEKVKK